MGDGKVAEEWGIKGWGGRVGDGEVVKGWGDGRGSEVTGRRGCGRGGGGVGKKRRGYRRGRGNGEGIEWGNGK